VHGTLQLQKCRRSKGSRGHEVGFERESPRDRRNTMGPGIQSDNGHSCEENLLGEMITCCIRSSADKDRSTALVDKVIDQRSGSL